MLPPDGFTRPHGKAALVIAANIPGRRINSAERDSAELCADAAGAPVIGACEESNRGIFCASVDPDGSRYGLVQMPAGGSNKPFHDGLDLRQTGMTMTDGRGVRQGRGHDDCLLQRTRPPQPSCRMTCGSPHQANARIFDAVGKNLGIADQAIVRTIVDYGNSSAATIPLSLSLANQAELFRPGEKILMAAAGAGLSGGALVVGI